MFAVSPKLPHNLSEMPEFVVAQPPLTTLDGELSNALRRVLADDIQSSRVAEKAPQGSDRAAGNSGAASRLAASPCLSASCRFARSYIGLHRLDVPEGEAADESTAQ